MDLQWPLIIFTAFVSWSAGLFATQSVLALKGEGRKAQLPALMTSLVILAVGGIAVFFHLEHWERIFNGFGHITSGITQELICVVLMVIVMVIYFATLRKSKEKGTVSKPVAIAGVITAALLVIIAGASYLMPARPAWSNPGEVLSLLGNACILGPATMMVIMGVCAKDEPISETALPKVLLIGAIINVATTLLYLAMMAFSTGSLVEYSYYADPSYMVAPMVSAENANPFAGSALIMSIAAIVAAIVAAAAPFLGKIKGNWMAAGAVSAAFGLVGAIALRMVFYTVGFSMFMPF